MVSNGGVKNGVVQQRRSQEQQSAAQHSKGIDLLRYTLFSEGRAAQSNAKVKLCGRCGAMALYWCALRRQRMAM